MRPFTAYQQAVNHDVLAALDELRASVNQLRRLEGRERARLLAELRRYDQLSSSIDGQARTIEQLVDRLESLARERNRTGS